jgi:hypothetical protein
MRNTGSDVVALKATAAVAAGLRVNEETNDGTRFEKWRPFDWSRVSGSQNIKKHALEAQKPLQDSGSGLKAA